MHKKVNSLAHSTKVIHKKLSKMQLFSSVFWFLVGFLLTGIFLTSFSLVAFQKIYSKKIYPGIFIGKEYVGGKTKDEVKELFTNKNKAIQTTQFVFTYDNQATTISAEMLHVGYDAELLADQAYALGRSRNIVSNIGIIFASYTNGTTLPPAYTTHETTLQDILKDTQKSIYKEPVEALFTLTNNKVTAFKQSEDGRTIDFDTLEMLTKNKVLALLAGQKATSFTIEIPIKILKPMVTTDKANNLGIVELIGEGKSNFFHSIPNRIHNVSLAASRINGILIKPGEIFSFNNALGDVSKFTGYKEAYIIQNGRTVLGDGGGVCQVSTTLFRALLNAGLPIVERHAHDYRVGYYEENSDPGLDATVFSPSFDLKFKNDTGHYILIQNIIDLDNLSLTFHLYGTKDDRIVTVTKPIVSNQSPPLPPLYQDDPTLPKGVEKQVDFAAWGARVSFQRTVTKDGKTYLADTFVSNYRPWQAVYLRGTKE